MPRLLVAIVVAGSIFYAGSDVLAMGGGGGRSHGSGSSSPGYSGPHTSTYNVGDGAVYRTPESGTILLLASGVVGLVLWHRRKR
jgi:hypothetical protein